MLEHIKSHGEVHPLPTTAAGSKMDQTQEVPTVFKYMMHTTS